MSKLQLAQQAKLLLSDPAFVAACARVESSLFAQWQSSLTAEKREAAWCELRGLNAVKASLSSIVNDGRIEAAAQEAQAPAGGSNQ